jgi:hypothetical protein
MYFAALSSGRRFLLQGSRVVLRFSAAYEDRLMYLKRSVRKPTPLTFLASPESNVVAKTWYKTPYELLERQRTSAHDIYRRGRAM